MNDKKQTMSDRERVREDKDTDIEQELDLDKKKKRTNKEYFWLKLQKDFFKRDDVELVKEMASGKEILLLYLELLSKSLNFNGRLMINESLAYNPEVISKTTRTKIDLVRQALEKFEQLGWIEMLEDNVIFMTELPKMTGYDTKYAIEKRKYREKEKQEKKLQAPRGAKICDTKSSEIDKLISNYTTNKELIDLLYNFVQTQSKMNTFRMKAHLANLNQIAENDAEKIWIVRKTVAGNYKGFFTLTKSEKEIISYNERQKQSKKSSEIDMSNYSDHACRAGVGFWQDGEGTYFWRDDDGTVHDKEDTVTYTNWIEKIKEGLE